MRHTLTKFFLIKQLKTSWPTEILAGLTTFVSMAYVIIVNPMILNDTGMDYGALIVATCIVAAFASIGMGLYARIPMAIAPALGISSYVVFTTVLKHGLPWEGALTACLFSGILLLILNILKIRQKILLSIPHSLLKGITCGIGLFLITVALKQIGMITLTKHHLIVFHPIMSHEIILTIFSVILIEVLLKVGFKSAFIVVILLNFIIALFLGIAQFQGITATPPSLAPTFLKLDFSWMKTSLFYKSFFSIFLVTLFDSTAGLITLGRILYPTGCIPRIRKALTPDSAGTILGSLIGSGPLAIHIESAAGIKVGGRTGVVSVVVGLCFVASLFFYPLISSIPEFASAPVLIALGLLMAKQLKGIEWKKASEIIPAVITLIIMPLTFSIYYGFALGFISYVLCKLFTEERKSIPKVCWIMALLFAIQLLAFE